MTNKKMSRVISVLAVLAMLAMLVPTVAFAGNTVDMAEPTYDPDTDTITVSGSISEETSGTRKPDVTIMAIRSDAPLEAIPADIDTNSNKIMFIDQITVDDTYEISKTFKLRDTDDGNYVTVFFGGTDVNTYVYRTVSVVVLKNPGTPVLVSTANGYYYDGAQALDLSGMDPAWLADVTIIGGVYNSNGERVGDVDSKGYVELDEAPAEVTEYTIKFIAVDGFKPVDDIAVSIIDADAGALKDYDGVAIWNVHSKDAETWTISIPEGNANVEIIVAGTQNGGSEEIITDNVSEGILSVSRTDTSVSYPYVVAVIAKAGEKLKVLGAFSVTEYGTQAAIDAGDVTVFSRNNVYGIDGGKLIKIVSASVTPDSQTIAVGGVILSYSSEKGAFYGVINAGILGTESITAENVAAVASPVDAPATAFYFGKANNPTKQASVTAQDVGAAKKIVLGTNIPTDVKYYFASDVKGSDLMAGDPDGNVTAQDVAALKKNVLNGEVLPIFKDVLN